jgi:dienelactone hydrolase
MVQNARRVRTRRGLKLLALVAAAAVSACTVPRPEGAEPLRYRDTVFTGHTVTSNLQYGSAPDLQGNPVALRLDLYRPAGDTQTSRPALVWAHGGSFISGSKTNTVPVDVATTFARRGYVVASIDYRLLAPAGCAANPGQAACITAAIEAQHDMQAAVRWLRANASTYGVDPARIGVGGESAGGIMATLTGLRPDDPGSSGNPGFPSGVRGFVSVAGGLPNGLFASAGDAAGLLFHGGADRVVPPDWSTQTAIALLNAGVPAWLQIQDGAGHVPWAQHRSLYIEQTSYFLYHALDLANAAGQPPSAARAAERQERRLRSHSRALDRMLDRHPRLRGAERRLR